MIPYVTSYLGIKPTPPSPMPDRVRWKGFPKCSRPNNIHKKISKEKTRKKSHEVLIGVDLGQIPCTAFIAVEVKKVSIVRIKQLNSQRLIRSGTS